MYNIYWPALAILTDINTQVQRGSGNDSCKIVHNSPLSFKRFYSVQFSVVLRKAFFEVGSYPSAEETTNCLAERGVLKKVNSELNPVADFDPLLSKVALVM